MPTIPPNPIPPGPHGNCAALWYRWSSTNVRASSMFLHSGFFGNVAQMNNIVAVSMAGLWAHLRPVMSRSWRLDQIQVFAFFGGALVAQRNYAINQQATRGLATLTAQTTICITAAPGRDNWMNYQRWMFPGANKSEVDDDLRVLPLGLSRWGQVATALTNMSSGVTNPFVWWQRKANVTLIPGFHFNVHPRAFYLRRRRDRGFSGSWPSYPNIPP